MAQKIAITISEGSVARNILRSGVLEHLLQKGGVKVFLLTFADKVDLYKEEFGGENVEIIGFPKNMLPTFFDRMLNFLCRNCFYTETLVSVQRTRYAEDRNFVYFFLKQALIKTLGRMSLIHRVIRFIASTRKPVSPLKEAFVRIQPNLLFVTDVQDDLDLHAIAVAKTQQVKVIGMVRSWDNLTNALVQVVLPKLFVGNEYIAWRATTIQHVPPDTAQIVGMPQYDVFFCREGIVSREEFLKSQGIDPKNKLVLFCATGTYFMPYEWEIPLMIQRAIDEGRLPKDTAIIARRHPNFPPSSEITGSKVYFDRSVSYYTNGSMSNWELGRQDIYHFANLMTHADVVVVGYSSITIDAAVFDRPVVNVAFDGPHDTPYDKSARRGYEVYSHYIALIKTGGAHVAWSEEEMVEWIGKYLNDPTLDREGRRKLREDFITFEDGKSAERIASAILELAR